MGAPAIWHGDEATKRETLMTHYQSPAITFTKTGKGVLTYLPYFLRNWGHNFDASQTMNL